jgi:hypothetical protein
MYNIIREIVFLMEGVEAAAERDGPYAARGVLEDALRGADDPVLQGRADECEGLIVLDVLRGWAESQRIKYDAIVREQEAREQEAWDEYGRDEYLQQQAWDAREFSRGEE